MTIGDIRDSAIRSTQNLYRRVVPVGAQRALGDFRVKRGWWIAPSSEATAIRPYAVGRCLEVGCGHLKTTPEVIGLDLIPGGSLGTTSNVRGQTSQADVAADGSRLPFRDQVFDSIIARHNLEHYRDVDATLSEWRRVLVEGGTLGIVVPDEGRYPGSTLDLDPTHHQAFTQASLTSIVERLGFRVERVKPVVRNWSFMLIAQRS